jgi:hypothetical protein
VGASATQIVMSPSPSNGRTLYPGFEGLYEARGAAIVD